MSEWKEANTEKPPIHVLKPDKTEAGSSPCLSAQLVNIVRQYEFNGCSAKLVLPSPNSGHFCKPDRTGVSRARGQVSAEDLKQESGIDRLADILAKNRPFIPMMVLSCLLRSSCLSCVLRSSRIDRYNG